MAAYLNYWIRMFKCALEGNRLYFIWIGFLCTLCIPGLIAYIIQLRTGFVVTNLSDQVSWGAYIANFTFLVGVAAAAVLLVVPTYLYHIKEVKEVVIIGELMAVSAIVMCLLFVVVDLGHPERFLHIIPIIGRLNFPQSILAWDIIVLNGYLLLNLHIPGYLLYRKYRGEEPKTKYYLPFVFISILWAISIHTVTAFLYSGLGGRPFWNSAILAPRFLISAFVSGPALMILIFDAINRFSKYHIKSTVSQTLVRIIIYTLPANLFLLGCEVFKEFYTGTLHATSAEYLFFGLHGHGMLVPYIWTSLLFSCTALVVFFTPKFRNNRKYLQAACVLAILGIWIEKGMGLIIPGFIPTPLGDLVEYTPSLVEFFVSLSIWSLGALIFTMMAKVALAIQHGHLRISSN